MNTSNNLPQLPPPRKSSGRWLYAAWLGVSILPLLTQPASATTIWEKATEIMKDVYQQILLISTIAAIVTASVALLMMNFSRSGRTVEESRAWLKRIAITWAILNAGLASSWPMSRRSSPAVSGRHKTWGFLTALSNGSPNRSCTVWTSSTRRYSVRSAAGWTRFCATFLPPRRCTIFLLPSGSV